MNRNCRRGSTLVIVVLACFTLFTFVAFAVDVGYLVTSKTELQRCADATAMAAMWEYGTELSANAGSYNQQGSSHSQAAVAAQSEATSLAVDNLICNETVSLPNADIKFGYMSDFADPQTTLNTSASTDLFNAVEVKVRRSEQTNGRIPLFFARMFGYNSLESEAVATAAMVRNVGGFTAPADGNLGILPIALDLKTWLDVKNGIGDDKWHYNKDTGALTEGSDGIAECNLYPSKKGGAPGNRGTVDIGAGGNSTNDIKRQITSGVSAADLAHIGGKLEFDANGEMMLEGDTGISTGIKGPLSARIGDTFSVPVFSKVQGPGNNAEYTIVRFVGVRLLDVNFSGSESKKRVIIQPATVMMRGVIPAPAGSTNLTSDFVYSNVFITR